MSFGDRFNKLTAREQKLAGLFVLFALLMVFVGAPAYAYMGIAEDREYNESIRTQLRRMDRGSELLAKRRKQREAREGHPGRRSGGAARQIALHGSLTGAASAGRRWR
jgi:hypothetical protein